MFTLERFFSRIYGFVYLALLVTVFTYGVGPKWSVIPALILFMILIKHSFKCAYLSERFSDYAVQCLWFNLSVSPLFAYLLTLAITYKKLKLGALESLALSALPLLLVALAYGLAWVCAGKVDTLVVQGDRIEVIEREHSGAPWMGGFGAALGGLMYPIVQTYSESMLILVYVLMACGLYMVYYHRQNIASFKALRARERRENKHYTFMELEHLRSLRARSWVGRGLALVKRVAGRRNG
ncbi:hypothetical protein [Pseudomonas sp. PSKL.D1]|uniref:hypothetical protein n=1 Tax=Pseudomonas sp. PSKL.D1 TaxID=3029060 RepID=UPI002380E46D|nr:hypothetical protein [Pseudomonas sp. PSKL.D1]WDY60282.1 hypothetical protein PVV54_11845 [Pseudomonas sp. PSKL.D1]